MQPPPPFTLYLQRDSSHSAKDALLYVYIPFFLTREDILTLSSVERLLCHAGEMDQWFKLTVSSTPPPLQEPFLTHLPLLFVLFLEKAMNVCFKEPCRALPWQNAKTWFSLNKLSARHTGCVLSSFPVQKAVGAAFMTLWKSTDSQVGKKGTRVVPWPAVCGCWKNIKDASHIPAAIPTDSKLCYLASSYAKPRDSDTNMWCIL